MNPMIETDRADHSRAKLDRDPIVPITNLNPLLHNLSLEKETCMYCWIY